MIDNPVPDAGGGCRIQVTIKFKVRRKGETRHFTNQGIRAPENKEELNYLILKEHRFQLTD